MSTNPDPQRLEEGLRQLRELGYLRTPASSYVARRVAGRGSLGRAVLASSLWIGAGTGLGFALLMTLSAVISDPGVVRAPRALLLLFLQLALVLTLLFAIVTGVFSSAVLVLHRRGGSIRGSATERLLVLVPGILATVYLVDRVGRALLEGAEKGIWGAAAALLVVFAGFFAAGLSGAMRGALAMVRLQLHGLWSPPQVGGLERAMPAIVGAVLSIVLLATGPYRPGDRLPWFDEVAVDPVASAEPLFLVGIDGLPGGAMPPGARRGVAAPAGEDSPTGYWNEIATGFLAREHGLQSPSTSAPRGWEWGGERLREDPVLGTLVDRLMPGIGLAEVHAADRRELRRPPVWEIFTRAGGRSRVVNWWGSYPAVRSPNLEVVSDRQWLRHFAGGLVDSLLAWPEYLLLDESGYLARRGAYAKRLEASGLPALLDSLQAPAEVREVFELAATGDLYHLERAREAQNAADLVAVLLSGPDILVRAAKGIDGWTEAAGSRFRQRYSGFLLAELGGGGAPGPGATWVLGVQRRADGGVSGTWGLGPWPPEPAEAAAAVLHRLGIPPARDMAGAGTDGPATYGLLRPGSVPAGRAAPDLEQLRSLGYIGD